MKLPVSQHPPLRQAAMLAAAFGYKARTPKYVRSTQRQACVGVGYFGQRGQGRSCSQTWPGIIWEAQSPMGLGAKFYSHLPFLLSSNRSPELQAPAPTAILPGRTFGRACISDWIAHWCVAPRLPLVSRDEESLHEQAPCWVKKRMFLGLRLLSCLFKPPHCPQATNAPVSLFTSVFIFLGMNIASRRVSGNSVW